MSYIEFADADGNDVKILGAERAWMACLCADITAGILSALGGYLDEGEKATLDQMVRSDFQWWRISGLGLSTFMTVGGERQGFKVADGFVSCFDLGLNTIMACGSNELRLCAVLHGQCELHCYVLGPNRAWLADLIGRGRASNILRADMNWEAAAEMLRASAERPVALSYSVSESFPNAHLAARGAAWSASVGSAGDLEDALYDWYDSLSAEEVFDYAFAALRKQDLEAGMGLEMRPENWSTRRCGPGHTAFDVLGEFYRLAGKTAPIGLP